MEIKILGQEGKNLPGTLSALDSVAALLLPHTPSAELNFGGGGGIDVELDFKNVGGNGEGDILLDGGGSITLVDGSSISFIEAGIFEVSLAPTLGVKSCNFASSDPCKTFWKIPVEPSTTT